MSITKTIVQQETLTEGLSKDILLESKRLTREYLDDALMMAKPGCRSITELVTVHRPDLLPTGAMTKQNIGMSLSPMGGQSPFYIFAFPDGSWFNHNLDSNTLLYAGSEFIWNQFLVKHLTTTEVN